MILRFKGKTMNDKYIYTTDNGDPEICGNCKYGHLPGKKYEPCAHCNDELNQWRPFDPDYETSQLRKTKPARQ